MPSINTAFYLSIGVLIAVITIITRSIEVDSVNGEVFAAIGGVASFLFGIIAAFTISDRHSRIENVLKNGSIERAELIMINDLSKVFSKATQKKLIADLDNYLMAEMDYPRRDFFRTHTAFNQIAKSVINIKPKTLQQEVAYTRMLANVDTIEQSRKHTSTLFGDQMSLREWIVLYFLSAVVLLSLILIEPGSFVVLAIIGGLAISMFYVLSIIHDFDSFDWRVEDKIIEPFQKAFEELGLLRYYSSGMIADHRIKNYKSHKKYRVGSLQAYPDLSSRVIEEVSS